jgi:hypothetical protein
MVYVKVQHEEEYYLSSSNINNQVIELPFYPLVGDKLKVNDFECIVIDRILLIGEEYPLINIKLIR